VKRGGQDIRRLLALSLSHKRLTDRLLHFVWEEGVARTFAALGRFSPGDAASALERELGYDLRDRVRLRMVRVLTDFLCECGQVEMKDGCYIWTAGECPGCVLSDEEEALAAGEALGGELAFFEGCIAHAGKFLRGAPPLYSFDSGAAHIWEEFLGNAEFNFARQVLAKMMLAGQNGGARVLDLCYGPGFDILHIQQCLGDVRVTALDFKDVFRNRALGRIPNPAGVEWIDSGRWQGFGSPLPFEDGTFDAAFFACADPYVPAELRGFVYRDIFRALKRGGSVNILSHSYPDPEKKDVYDPWVRKGTLCHDFSESVCEGWQGFYDAAESRGLFEAVGFVIGDVMMNASVWRLDKP
jgi:ubiquinone/menaquinone biosynthesis C-methylase UbiE